jgi:Fic family protein
MRKPTAKQVEEFLRESNAIEGVYDIDSLKQAKLAWKYLMTQKVLTPAVILDTHKILMLHQNLQPNHKGYFRDCEVTVGGTYGLNWGKIPEAIESWCKDVAISLKIPGEDGKHFKIDHITYEHIHPFVDGNGRTGRLFLNWERLKAGLPLLIIHEGFEQYEYYKWFRTEEVEID